MRNTYTLAILLYGNFPELAHRCLHSILDMLSHSKAQDSKQSTDIHDRVKDIRIGLHHVGTHTFQFVREATYQLNRLGFPVVWYVPEIHKDTPALKYPTMRRMLYGFHPVTTSHFMWFDDDTVIMPPKDWVMDWFTAVNLEVDNQTAVLGIKYMRDFEVSQLNWIHGQPWSSGYEPRKHRVQFPAGSWWVGNVSFLKRYDYPFPELRHCGGDSMLGHLLAATKSDVAWVDNLVFHNCNGTLEPSSAPRRGYDEKQFASDFVGFPLSKDHQLIDYLVTRFESNGECRHARDYGGAPGPGRPAEPENYFAGQEAVRRP